MTVTSANPFSDPTRDSFIEFTQYLLPDGKRVTNPFVTTKEIAQMGEDLIKAGYRFEVEILTTGDISATIVGKIPDSEEDGDVAQIVIPNDPNVGVRVDEMISRFHFNTFPGQYHG